jgi:hypothetical protein
LLVRSSTIFAIGAPLNGEIFLYETGAPASGIGSEHSWPFMIGLGHPPFAESNPLRLRMSFIGVTSRRHAIFFDELATRKISDAGI